MPPCTVSVTMSWEAVYRWQCNMFDLCFLLSGCLCGFSSLQPHSAFIPFINKPGTVKTLPSVWSCSLENCNKQSPTKPLRDESAGAPPNESYWRDTWRRLSSAPSPGRCCCCCCACASYQSSDTTCTLSPARVKNRAGHLFRGSTKVVGKERYDKCWGNLSTMHIERFLIFC